MTDNYMVLDGELRCPVCGYARWAVETDHLHCGRCSEVVRFNEVAKFIGKQEWKKK